METSKFFTYCITALSFLLPIFFLPLTYEFYIFNKVTLLYFATGLLLIAWAINSYFKQELVFKKSSFNASVIGLMVSFLLSTLIQSPNHYFTLLNQTGVILSLGILFFILVNNVSGKNAVTWILGGLVASSAVLGLLQVLTYVGLNANLGLDWLSPKSWTPSGSPIFTLTFLLTLLPATLYWAFKIENPTQKILLFLAGSLQTLGSFLIVALYLNKVLTINLLPPAFGWQISVEGFKTFKTAVFGIGPGNFSNAFTRFKPMSINNDNNLWTLIFGNNTNEYLNMLSTVGSLGFLFYFLILLPGLKRANFSGSLAQRLVYLILLSSAIVQLLTNANLLIWYATIIAYALYIALKQKPAELWENQTVKVSQKWGVVVLAVIFVLVSLPGFFFQGKAWLGDYYFRQSVLAASQNRGLDTYNLQVSAIKYNPSSELYHISFANTNFLLANSLASRQNLTDQDKASINQLISQSIQEAKFAANLNPGNSSYWITLAEIYRNIINVAQGADQWTAAAYLQAINVDPLNPVLRVNFGGLYYALGAFDQAIDQFKIAVNLKPDYANAYYNLAAAYKQKQDWVNAYNNLMTAINLVPESADKDKATAELKEIQAKLPATAQTATPSAELKENQKLNQPTPIPSPKSGFDQITLPEDAAPPSPPPASPSPSPSPSQEASPVPASPAPSANP